MNTPSKWFLAIASLFVVCVIIVLIVYDQPKSQAKPATKLHLEILPVEEADAKAALEYQTKGFAEELGMETDPNIRIDLLRDYLLAIVDVDEFNAQEAYEGRPTLDNKGQQITALMGALTVADIEKDTTIVFERYDDYVGASGHYLDLIETSQGEDVTKEEQKEIEKAQLKFETASQELIDSVDQLYP